MVPFWSDYDRDQPRVVRSPSDHSAQVKDSHFPSLQVFYSTEVSNFLTRTR